MSYLVNPYMVTTPVVPIDYEQMTGSNSCVFQDGTVATAKKICGEMVANTSSVLFGKKITNIEIPLQRQDFPSSIVYARHYDASLTLLTTYWQKDANTLTTSMVLYGDGLYTGTDTAFQVGDFFCSEYANAGAKYVLSQHTGSGSVFDGSNSHFVSVDNSDTFTTSGTTDDTNFKITVV